MRAEGRRSALETQMDPSPSSQRNAAGSVSSTVTVTRPSMVSGSVSKHRVIWSSAPSRAGQTTVAMGVPTGSVGMEQLMGARRAMGSTKLTPSGRPTVALKGAAALTSGSTTAMTVVSTGQALHALGASSQRETATVGLIVSGMQIFFFFFFFFFSKRSPFFPRRASFPLKRPARSSLSISEANRSTFRSPNPPKSFMSKRDERSFVVFAKSAKSIIAPTPRGCGTAASVARATATFAFIFEPRLYMYKGGQLLHD
mmetsp:Transcript_38949/g.76563  ORF Transcript_38949/g.76563 Transcript_38949/m.76563 type:complete len:256 (+) Transcript_38949:2347-3114(+)